jgi:hypothetical protein
VFLDVGGYDALLPNGKTAPRWRAAAPNIPMAVQEIMRDHNGKRFSVQVDLGTVVDWRGQLNRGLPLEVIFEEYAGWICLSYLARIGKEREPGRIQIKTDHATPNVRVLQLAIVMTGRHEGELAPQRP